MRVTRHRSKVSIPFVKMPALLTLLLLGVTPIGCGDPRISSDFDQEPTPPAGPRPEDTARPPAALPGQSPSPVPLTYTYLPILSPWGKDFFPTPSPSPSPSPSQSSTPLSYVNWEHFLHFSGGEIARSREEITVELLYRGPSGMYPSYGNMLKCQVHLDSTFKIQVKYPGGGTTTRSGPFWWPIRPKVSLSDIAVHDGSKITVTHDVSFAGEDMKHITEVYCEINDKNRNTATSDLIIRSEI